VKRGTQGSKLSRAEPMLRASSSSVLRSNFRGAGVTEQPLEAIFPPIFRATPGTNERGACEHRLAVCVRTTASKQ
jgi:hypothetical protein